MRKLFAVLALTIAAGVPAFATLAPPSPPRERAPAATDLIANTPIVAKRCTSRGGWRRLRSYYAAGTKCV